MTAQPESYCPQPQSERIPYTIDAVAEALGGAQRMAFYAEIGPAEGGEKLNEVLRKWWIEAMCAQRPGHERRVADAAAGRRLIPLEDLAGLPEGEE